MNVFDKIITTIIKNSLNDKVTQIEYYLTKTQKYGIKIVQLIDNTKKTVFEKSEISENAEYVKNLIEIIAKSTYNFELLNDILDDLENNNSITV